MLYNSIRSDHSIYSIGKQTEEICRTVFDLISVFRFGILTEDYETTKFQVLKEKAYMRVQVIENYRHSGYKKVLDTVLGDYEKFKFPMIAMIRLMSPMGGVKVLSEKTGNDDNF